MPQPRSTGHPEAPCLTASPTIRRSRRPGAGTGKAVPASCLTWQKRLRPDRWRRRPLRRLNQGATPRTSLAGRLLAARRRQSAEAAVSKHCFRPAAGRARAGSERCRCDGDTNSYPLSCAAATSARRSSRQRFWPGARWGSCTSARVRHSACSANTASVGASGTSRGATRVQHASAPERPARAAYRSNAAVPRQPSLPSRLVCSDPARDRP